MTPRHPLDGNAIAADRHYGQDRAEDFDFCEDCGLPFQRDFAREDFVTVPQHPVMFMLCEDCAEAMGDAE